MQSADRLCVEPSLVAWARTARPVRVPWRTRAATTARGAPGPDTDRDATYDAYRAQSLDDALFGSASLALAAVVVVATLIV